MKTTQSSGTRPVHQTVAGEFNFKSSGKAIAVEFTDQRLSPHAGSATFWGWLHPSGWIKTLAAALPHAPALSNNRLSALAKALAFTHGLLCEARKLTHVAYLRRDPLVPELLGITRVPSQTTLSRFFAEFGSAAVNLRCFRPLWYWCVQRLPSAKEGYTLDLDSTRLCLAVLTYNLTVLFQRHLGWQTKVTIQSLRFCLFGLGHFHVCAARQLQDQGGGAGSSGHLRFEPTGSTNRRHWRNDLRLPSLPSLPCPAGQGLVFDTHHGGKLRPADPAPLKLLQQLLPLYRRHPNPPLAIRLDYSAVSFDHICHITML